VTFGETSSAGVPQSFADQTIVIDLHDTAALEAVFAQFEDQIAAVIIEGIPANNGLLLQSKAYMQFLRQISQANGSLLIMDEVITGFRLGIEGASAYYDIQPDIITYGKIIGGGMPVGAYGASAALMGHISPDGPVYQAGTLSGNPVAMSAGIATLKTLLQPDFYTRLNDKTAEFVNDLRNHIRAKGYPVQLFHIASIFWFAFSQQEVIQQAKQIDPNSMILYKEMHRELLNRGIYFGPSGYEVGFISAAHTADDLSKAKEAIFTALAIIFANK